MACLALWFLFATGAALSAQQEAPCGPTSTNDCHASSVHPYSYASDGIVALLQVSRHIWARKPQANFERISEEELGSASGFLAPKRASIRHRWQRQKRVAAKAALLEGASSALTEDDRMLAEEITHLHQELEDLWGESSISAGAEEQTQAWMSLVGTKAKLDVAYGKTRTRYEALYRQIVQFQEDLEKLGADQASEQRRLQTNIASLQARSKELSQMVTGVQEEKEESVNAAPLVVAIGGVVAEGASDAKDEVQMASTLVEKHHQLEELWGKLVEAGRQGGAESGAAAQAERWTSLVEAKMSLDKAYEGTRTRYEELYRQIIRLREKRKKADDAESKQSLQEEIDALKKRAKALERLANNGGEKSV